MSETQLRNVTPCGLAVRLGSGMELRGWLGEKRNLGKLIVGAVFA